MTVLKERSKRHQASAADRVTPGSSYRCVSRDRGIKASPSTYPTKFPVVLVAVAHRLASPVSREVQQLDLRNEPIASRRLWRQLAPVPGYVASNLSRGDETQELAPLLNFGITALRSLCSVQFSVKIRQVRVSCFVISAPAGESIWGVVKNFVSHVSDVTRHESDGGQILIEK